jgi:hypothetical protein
MAKQMGEGDKPVDLEACIGMGTVSGGFCCFYVGGTHVEEYPGEKEKLLIPYLNLYKEQIGG